MASNKPMYKTINDIIDDLLSLEDVQKAVLYQQYNTGRELTIEELLMTFNNEQLLDICEEFDARLLADYPRFAREIALQKNILVSDYFNDDIINLQDELELLETEHEFVSINSTEITDDMPDAKKVKNES